METGLPSTRRLGPLTRAVNSGSGKRALVLLSPKVATQRVECRVDVVTAVRLW